MTVRTKLDHINPEMQDTEEDDRIDQKDAEYKEKMRRKREGRQMKEGRLLLGNYVLVKQPKRNKWSTPYEPVFYIVNDIQGSRITARRTTDGRIVCRDASQFKLVNTVINTADEQEAKEETTQPEVKPYLTYHSLRSLMSPIRRRQVQTQGRRIHLLRNRETQRQMQEEAKLK